jgi:hypothetical protein
MKQIDYELRGMKVPFLGDAPLASSYAEKSGYALTDENTYFNFCDTYSNSNGDEILSLNSKIQTQKDIITSHTNSNKNWQKYLDIEQGRYDDVNHPNKTRREENLKKGYASNIASLKAKIKSNNDEIKLANDEILRLESLKEDLIKAQQAQQQAEQAQQQAEQDLINANKSETEQKAQSWSAGSSGVVLELSNKVKDDILSKTSEFEVSNNDYINKKIIAIGGSIILLLGVAYFLSKK